jgi:hypothetical protein
VCGVTEDDSRSGKVMWGAFDRYQRQVGIPSELQFEIVWCDEIGRYSGKINVEEIIDLVRFRLEFRKYCRGEE